jgi:hypothetical protein
MFGLPWATAMAVTFNIKQARIAPSQLILFQLLRCISKRGKVIYNCRIWRLLDESTVGTRCTYLWWQSRRDKTCIIMGRSAKLWGKVPFQGSHIRASLWVMLERFPQWDLEGKRRTSQSSLASIDSADRWSVDQSWSIAGRRTNKYNTRDMDHFPVQKYLIFVATLVLQHIYDKENPSSLRHQLSENIRTPRYRMMRWQGI